MDRGRDRGVPGPAGLTPAPFWPELSRAAAPVPGARLEDKGGYARLTLTVPGIPDGLSARTRELVAAHPAAADGRRTIVVDVRNRQWLAMAEELLAAVSRAERG